MPRRQKRFFLLLLSAVALLSIIIPVSLAATPAMAVKPVGGVPAATPTPAPTAAAPVGTASDKLTFAPPADYQSYNVKDFTTKTSLGSYSIKLGAGNWLIKLPTDRPIDAPVGLQVTMRSSTDKPNNVVIIGGEVRVTGNDSAGVQRAAYLNNWTGTFYMEGVHFTSADNNLGEGINAYSPAANATLVMQNIQVDLLHGSYSGHHADAFQVWNGPYNVKIDGFEVASQYQGMFLLPNQHYSGTYPTGGVYDFHRVHIDSTDATGYSLWRNASFTALTDQVYVDAPPSRVADGTVLWTAALWPGVQANVPHGPVLTGVPGYGYVSPGYLL